MLSQQLLERARARAISSPEGCTTLDVLAGELHAVEPAEIDGDATRLRFVEARLDGDDAEWLRTNRDRVRIDYGAYDWTISLAG